MPCLASLTSSGKSGVNFARELHKAPAGVPLQGGAGWLLIKRGKTPPPLQEPGVVVYQSRPEWWG